MALFGIKKKDAPVVYPEKTYIYKQSKNYRGYKRIRLTSYNYQPAQDGIRALSGADLSEADIKITVVDKPGEPYATVMVGPHLAGTIFRSSFDRFDDLRDGKVVGVRLEVRDGESYLFYKV
jgi:hypothetical protein